MMHPDLNEQSLTEVNLPEYTGGDYHEFQMVSLYFPFPLLGDNYLYNMYLIAGRSITFLMVLMVVMWM